MTKGGSACRVGFCQQDEQRRRAHEMVAYMWRPAHDVLLASDKVLSDPAYAARAAVWSDSTFCGN